MTIFNYDNACGISREGIWKNKGNQLKKSIY